MKELLEQFRGREQVPAVAAAIVDADGIVESAVAGVRRRDATDEVRMSDAWHIGSCAKAMTAVLWARLVEHDLATWDMPLVEALGRPRGHVHADWADQTVDDALRWRAGVRPNLAPSAMRQAWADSRPLEEQRFDIAEGVMASPPRQPGRFAYSNLSYMLVAAAVDRLASMPFERALDVYVHQPLSISSAGFGAPAHVLGHGPRIRLGPMSALRGGPVEPSHPSSDNPPVMSAAGTVHLDIKDWARLVHVFLDDGTAASQASAGTLLRPETIERLLTSVAAGHTSAAMGWMPADRSAVLSYAMQGSNTLWSAMAGLDSDRRRGVVVVANDGRTRVLRATLRLALQLLP